MESECNSGWLTCRGEPQRGQRPSRFAAATLPQSRHRLDPLCFTDPPSATKLLRNLVLLYYRWKSSAWAGRGVNVSSHRDLDHPRHEGLNRDEDGFDCRRQRAEHEAFS